jgi:hypothetical protein
MSTPATADTFEAKVNAIIKQATKNEEGKLVLPEGLDEATAFAARAEIRRRDTQAEFTRLSQTNSTMQKQLDVLSSELESEIVKTAPLSEQARLEELKVANPDAWREELGKLEQAARGKAKERINKARDAASMEDVVAQRAAQLQEFKQANPGFELTDDIIASELPPRMVKDLEAGKITFEDFLAKSHKFLTGNVHIAPAEKAPNLPDLGKVGGKSDPLSADSKAAKNSSYNSEIY